MAVAAALEKEWSPERVQEAAARCNEMRMAAKGAQDRSDYVYLCVLLKRMKEQSGSSSGGGGGGGGSGAGDDCLEDDAVVIGVGSNSFTLLTQRLGLEERVFVDKMSTYGDGSAVAVAAWDEKREVLTLSRSGGASPSWRRLDVALFARLRVRLTCRLQAPLAVEIQVTRQLSVSPLLK